MKMSGETSTVKKVIIGLVVILLILMVVILYYAATCVKVYKFYRPGCKFCIDLQPEWEKLEDMARYDNVRFISINMDKAEPIDKSLFDNMGGTGVPLIVKVYPDGFREKYEDERVAHKMYQWATIRQIIV